jgi:hypothetical protein
MKLTQALERLKMFSYGASNGGNVPRMLTSPRDSAFEDYFALSRELLS